MSAIPQEALDAAAARLAAIDGKGAADPEHIRCASLILLDAAPHIVAAEVQRVRHLGDEPLTHFFHCWRFPEHHACAVELIERQGRENCDLIVRLDKAERAA